MPVTPNPFLNSPFPNPFASADGADFQKLQGDIYKNWEKSMGAWWDQVLESPSFHDTIKTVGPMAQARGQYRSAMDSALRELQLPTRDDVVRLTKIVTQVEDRLLQQEDILLQMQDRLIAMEREALKARIEAAEARLAAAGALSAVERVVDRESEADPSIVAPAASPVGTPTPNGLAANRARRGSK